MGNVMKRFIWLCVLTLVFALSGGADAGTKTCSNFPGFCKSPTNYFTNQGGFTGPCPVTNLPVGVATQVASDNAGPYSLNSWNYDAQGYVNLKNGNTFDVSTDVNLQMNGGFNWTHTYVVKAGEERQIFFMGITPDQPPTVFAAFFLLVTPHEGPLTCTDASWRSDEHD